MEKIKLDNYVFIIRDLLRELELDSRYIIGHDFRNNKKIITLEFYGQSKFFDMIIYFYKNKKSVYQGTMRKTTYVIIQKHFFWLAEVIDEKLDDVNYEYQFTCTSPINNRYFFNITSREIWKR